MMSKCGHTNIYIDLESMIFPKVLPVMCSNNSVLKPGQVTSKKYLNSAQLVVICCC